MTRHRTPLYRHTGIALLRAAARSFSEVPDRWPDFGDIDLCVTWLRKVWDDRLFSDAVRQASPGVAARVDAILDGGPVPARRVRRTTMSLARYALRAAGRPTPFGWFAGTAPASLGSGTAVSWGYEHRALARPDALWLSTVIDLLEGMPELVDRTEVTWSNLVTERGGRLLVPKGPDAVSIRSTSVVRAVREATADRPVRTGTLAERIGAPHPGAGGVSAARTMLTSLIRQGFLITVVRAPMTDPEPLAPPAPDWPERVRSAWRRRANALAEYRTRLLPESDTDHILGSLLHMHHNRARGIDPDHESLCHHLVRAAARAWLNLNTAVS
ncbi:lantibiotic dehydratase [Streptomyces sp. NPDC055078]